MAWRIIGRLESGQIQRTIEDAVEASRIVIARLWNPFQKQGMFDVDQDKIVPRGTRANNDQCILLTALRDRPDNVVQNHRQFLFAIKRRVLSQAIRNRLHAGDLQDNARPHTARLVENFLEAETKQRMERQHAQLILMRSSMLGAHSDDALLQDQGILSLSKTWRSHFVTIATVFHEGFRDLATNCIYHFQIWRLIPYSISKFGD
ncbi:hypothetical protein TNCV_2706391 [Trichonephila clavipes]|nr:hypothetical protein TNCV_2706391 [Trichonephila clavipes]